LPLDDLSDT
uniref:U1-poneritoxin-Dq1b n=1 Tax=Dinoponera quadriceps TaxID=609295 RepID=TX1AB_DINQU|nr:RecName: Full=U1-poneritoxin-Dq1b; Short=U1-PONTX-Dq1b; AltName: Full=Peptide Dq-987; AltName: Full=Poneratoxin; Contains: RecName: Full=U1-poneritoxin-Dq1a; Short=U1-PONTX-Dq1a; AltName: Full=Peptide Dq-761 [Dinoponera quadriceps]